MSQQHASLLRALSYQFDGMGLPKHLQDMAVHKILGSVMDAGQYVTFVERETDEDDDDSEEEENEESADGLVAEKDNEREGEGDKGITEGDDCIDNDDDCEGIARYHRTRYNLCVCCEEELKAESVVFLLDHMWTTTFPQSREQLQTIPGLAERIAEAIGMQHIGSEPKPESESKIKPESEPGSGSSLVDRVWKAMWPHLNCYNVPGDEYTRWYMMDEVGTSISHSSDPSFRVAPLLVSLSPSQMFGISLMW